MPLEREQATYARHLQELLPSAGRFVVIGGDEVVGIFDTYDDAMQVGYGRFKLEPFLVRQIEVDDRVRRFTRDFGTACPT